MKILSLVRHSIAQEPEEVENDLMRSLTEAGITLAKQIASQINPKYFINATFISSPANRAIETAHIFANIANIKSEQIIQNEFLYSCFKEQSFFYFLEEQIPASENGWIFGHNPMISNLFRILSRQNLSMPKCAVAIFQSSANSWLEVDAKNTQLIEFVNPKLIRK